MVSKSACSLIMIIQLPERLDTVLRAIENRNYSSFWNIAGLWGKNGLQ